MRAAHRGVGILFVVVFLATGVYLRLTLPPPAEHDLGLRMMLRSGHVYILMGALLNLAVAVAGAGAAPGSRRERLGGLGSLLLILAPAVFTAGFFLEPAAGSLHRPWSVAGTACMLLGTVLHNAGKRPRRA